MFCGAADREMQAETFAARGPADNAMREFCGNPKAWLR
jgi:hypothetical protein